MPLKFYQMVLCVVKTIVEKLNRITANKWTPKKRKVFLVVELCSLDSIQNGPTIPSSGKVYMGCLKESKSKVSFKSNMFLYLAFSWLLFVWNDTFATRDTLQNRKSSIIY